MYLKTEGPLGAPRVVRDLRAVLDPGVTIIGNQGLTPVAWFFGAAGSAARGVIMTVPGMTVDAVGPRGRRFLREFKTALPKHRLYYLDVYATAATEALLDAIARSDGTRESVARALKSTHLADSPIGPLSFAADGEPASNPISVLRIERRRKNLGLILDTRGARRIGSVDPPARLVGAG